MLFLSSELIDLVQRDSSFEYRYRKGLWKHVDCKPITWSSEEFMSHNLANPGAIVRVYAQNRSDEVLSFCADGVAPMFQPVFVAWEAKISMHRLGVDLIDLIFTFCLS